MKFAKLRPVQTIMLATIVSVAGGIAGTSSGLAQSDEDLAKKLANPIASLISVPFQFNYDEGFGTADGEHVLLNVQPVVGEETGDDRSGKGGVSPVVQGP